MQIHSRLSLLSALLLGSAAFALAANHSNYSAEARETLSRTLSAAKTLDVDNINGFIEVTGDGGNNVRVEGEKIIRALDQTELNRAKREVTLDINEKDGVLQLYVNGPFRQHGQPGDYHGFHERSDHEYEVIYNFTIHVPRQMELALRTINGNITASNTSGHFDLHGVNGGVTMTGVAGSGSVRTVNGPATVSFRENPRAPSRFQSVNGRLSLTFQPNLAADIHFKTLNGGVYTDFESTALSSTLAAKPESRNGRFVYRQDRGGAVRVGSGGPQIDLETVNGAIEIHKQAN
jgi:DUF4097 and DUF4098 domain-containing protein YvlB